MFNPAMLFQMIRTGGDFQQMTNMLIQQNPQMKQILNGVNINDPNVMEQICKNICQQKGLDFNTMLTQFKQNSGMR